MSIASKFGTECDRIKVGNEMMSDFKMVRDYAFGQNEILHIYDESAVTIFVQRSGLDLSSNAMTNAHSNTTTNTNPNGRRSTATAHNEAIEIKMNRKLTVQHIKYRISTILGYPMKSQTLIMKEVLSDSQLISECGLKNGDTVRLLYNFGKRVKKLPNQRLKVPVARFDGSDRFEVIVDRDILVSDLMAQIESEQGIESGKQRLLFHGVPLRRDERLSAFNVTHELHLQVAK